MAYYIIGKLKEKGNENILEQLVAGVKPFDRKGIKKKQEQLTSKRTKRMNFDFM
ncbi:MAG: hypothetical protein ACTHML_10670 [Ginsengibacter sp.]